MKTLVRPPIPLNRDNSVDSIRLSVVGIQRWSEQVSRAINNLVSNIPTDSTAVDVAGVVSDLNDLLAVLRGLDVK